MSTWPESHCFRCGTVTRSWFLAQDARCCPACYDALTAKPPTQPVSKPPRKSRAENLRAWRKRNAEPARLQARVAAELRRIPGLRAAIFNRDGNRCLACGVASDLVIDHIKPVLQGGTNDFTNLQTLCRSCNTKKRGAVDHRRSA